MRRMFGCLDWIAAIELESPHLRPRESSAGGGEGGVFTSVHIHASANLKLLPKLKHLLFNFASSPSPTSTVTSKLQVIHPSPYQSI